MIKVIGLISLFFFVPFQGHCKTYTHSGGNWILWVPDNWVLDSCDGDAFMAASQDSEAYLFSAVYESAEKAGRGFDSLVFGEQAMFEQFSAQKNENIALNDVNGTVIYGTGLYQTTAVEVTIYRLNAENMYCILILFGTQQGWESNENDISAVIQQINSPE